MHGNIGCQPGSRKNPQKKSELSWIMKVAWAFLTTKEKKEKRVSEEEGPAHIKSLSG